MEHFVSLATKPGKGSRSMRRCPIGDALKFVLDNPYDGKDDCWLISNGYKDTNGLYTREEWNFQWIDTIFIDCDNGKDEDPSTWDSALMDKFKCEFNDYAYYLWESASSIPERPKFRTIILLDERVEWVNEPEKITKNVVKEMFSKWTDDKASWYYSPTTSKVSTFVFHRGKAFPSSTIRERMQLRRMFSQMENGLREIETRRAALRARRHDPNGWRRLPKVKICLEGMAPHTKHSSICAALYAMDNLKYYDQIPEFLNEIAPQITKKHYDYWFRKWRTHNI